MDMNQESKKQKNKRIQKTIRLSNITTILKDLKIPYVEKRYKDYWFKCPLPSHKERNPSCHITANPYSPYYGIWHCFGCKTSGSIIELAKFTNNLTFWKALYWIEGRLVDDEAQVILNHIAKTKVELPKHFKSPKSTSKWNWNYLMYLFGRGISIDQIKKYNIGYCEEGKYKNRIIVPIKLNGELRTWTAIDATGSSNKKALVCPTVLGGRPGLFGSEFSNPNKGPAIIVEGWADALMLDRLGYQNVMATSGNKISLDQFAFLQHFPNIIVMPDGDSGGNLFINSLNIYVREKDIYIAKLPRGKDPDKCEEEEIDTSLKNISSWKPYAEQREVVIQY